ncbi:MAG: hypothetical protein SLAVMIC_00688 [uncultured marine phage]|uniref:Uncharacterized protein n=1 Tax=uncultured marine phage TaxID=707152 RepID=A0A8D9FQF3_9VIRU|nr:MAG: hypothetical protein SLAVMIC_00688 [uncultured marine phage]
MDKSNNPFFYYEITLNYIIPNAETTQVGGGTANGTITQEPPYYEGRIIRLGVSATGSSYNDALDNTIIAASGSSFNTSY